ncbi:hypothetical protein [Paenibacillus glycanilyticus]|uniref:Glycerophosphoryl diester phosphodiesterase membrane domain-containing protein n=1 Tax=Paenibacillus glycanilyticus TaxID=126569 RepID=A0ABQ6GKW1_9BACL|nr:hypothetical protein [Paenibacillus glycanilyticus]GLX70880.1 hypothetical protein MU1_52270 [Paenibacillus glycanilyticus]
MIPAMTDLPELRSAKGGVLGLTFSLFIKNAGMLLLLTAITVVPVELVLCYGFNELSIDSVLRDTIVSLLFLSLLTPVVVQYLIERLRGGKGSIAGAYRWGLRKWPRIIMYTFLQSVIVSAGFLLLIVPGLFMYVRLLLLPAVVSIENTSVMNPLESSRTMAQGRFWAIIGLGLVTNLFTLLLGLVADKLLNQLDLINGFTVTLYYLFIDWISVLGTILSLVLYLQIRTEQKREAVQPVEEATLHA